MLNYFIFIYLCAFTSFVVPGKFLGFNIGGWLWVLILGVSGIIVIRNLGRIRFPLGIWIPWMLLVLLNSLSGNPDAFQATAQILCPVVVGLAASSLPPEPAVWKKIVQWTHYLFYAYFGFVCFVVLPFALAKDENSGFPTIAISSLYFQTFFLCSYLIEGKNRRDLMLFLAALAVPVISTNRGPLLGSFILILLNFAPLSLLKRLSIIAFAVFFGLFAFYTPKIQKKMFYSSHGDFADLRWDNPDLNTNARKPMWDLLIAGIKQKPWLGYGAKGEYVCLKQNNFALDQPHNDWLRIGYNYGIVGMVIYFLTLIAQMVSCYRLAFTTHRHLLLIASISASCFIPYMILMLTDNILVYVQYYTALHFMLLGTVYGLARNVSVVSGFTAVASHRLVLKRVSPEI